VDFDQVFLVGEDDDLHVGKPLLEGARVIGNITGQEKGKKVLVFKFKRRKGYRRKRGHRQLFTRVQIDQIELKASDADKKTTPEATAKAGSADPTKSAVKSEPKRKVSKADASEPDKISPRKTRTTTGAKAGAEAKKPTAKTPKTATKKKTAKKATKSKKS